MNKIRLLLIVLMVASCSFLKAQIMTSAYYDGYWGKWASHGERFSIGYSTYDTYKFKLYGNYGGFIIYDKSDHPSEYIFKFKADNYTTPDKKTIKYHYKNNVWYEYQGTVEYYVTESYPTIASILKAFNFPYFNSDSGSVGNPCVKRTTKATIKIAPYKQRPEVYNIMFDGVGVGIYLDNIRF